ncbi:prepilin-type N-terminal cleavage/methylation domain-containing protein [Sporosarcina psychrophila]|uniref:prepilin-type N-terminal cleavage/methylation domain-containing protein n=1 Tax=Sporosarcina psychrophila TaxID=1476 RepID=UPI0030D0E756
MKKLLQKRLNNEKGLTLVELLAVIVILGIIAAIAIPSIGGVIENSRVKAQFADGQNILAAANIYFTENSSEPNVSIKKLVDEDYLDNPGSFSKTDDVGAVTKQKGGNMLSATTNATKKKVVFLNATVDSISLAKAKGGNTPTVTVPES